MLFPSACQIKCEFTKRNAGGRVEGGGGASTIYTLASVCRLRVADTRNFIIRWREGGVGDEVKGRGGGAVAHVGIQFYTNLLLFLPKRARSRSNFHSFCSRHTVDSAKLGRLLFLLLFGQLLLGSSIFYASKSNNLRISYGHTYFTCFLLSPSLSLPLSHPLSLLLSLAHSHRA